MLNYVDDCHCVQTASKKYVETDTFSLSPQMNDLNSGLQKEKALSASTHWVTARLKQIMVFIHF